MKVRDLLLQLESADPDANVYITTQPNYPIEESVVRCVVRGDVIDDPDTAQFLNGAQASDVLLAGGGMTRYGTRRAW